MTDLKELIEQELDQYLEWPTTDKSHVTTVSAKLFAEHVARLYAGQIAEARKKASRPQIREVFLRNGARIEPDHDDLPDYVYESVFELLDSVIQQAGPAIQYVAPAVQGEPVAVMYEDGSLLSKAACGVNFEACCKVQTPPYPAPQPAEQQPRSDALIVEQTERVAAILAEAFFNMELPHGENFRDIENPRVRKCWRIAADIQEELTDTDVENALAELEGGQQPELDKYQPCGCVICTCEHETQCQGCGAKHCGTHLVGQIPGPVYQQPAPDVAALVEALDLALEYWRDRQQRYKNRRPKWVIAAESALAAHRKEGEV